MTKSSTSIGDPGAGFQGTIGRTLAESLPHWRAPARPQAGRPNVIVVLLDDLGYSDFGCFGGEIATPHIDKLAAEGLRFTGYTTVPMCTPARAALLTGKNPHSVGCGWLTHNDPGYPGYKGEMSLDAPTLAELLRAQGYATMAVGKWHNTYDHNAHIGGDSSSWPVQRGFDRFYGFMGAETSYFHPDRMMEGNQLAQVDQYPQGYFAPDDYTGRAIGWLAEQRASAPEQPFFLYLAFQTPHAPLQAKPEDLARVRGRYDAGWDAMRAERYARQREAGLIEDKATLPGRNPGVPAWDELDEGQRALHARSMEVYAALVGNADDNVSRVVEFLRASGQLDNTLILITSDNGANAVGGAEGLMNLQNKRAGMPEQPELNARLLREDRIGGPDSYVAYPTGWTQVSNTPYRYYKRTPMAGGIRVPLVAHWPQGIRGAGDLRRQWVHVTDIAPTVLELAGCPYPEEFKGFRTRGQDGASFASMFGDASAPQRRQRQYYELAGNRGYISGSWKIVSLQVPSTPLRADNWMLFDLASDPSETQDLAAQHPEILQRLVAQFEEDAGANYVYPLDTRDESRAGAQPPYVRGTLSTPRDFFPGVQQVPSVVMTPLVGMDRSFRLRASFEWQPGDEGVVYAIGDRFAGMALYVMDGRLHYVHQWWFSPVELAPLPLEPGRQVFELDYRAVGGRRGAGRISLNGRCTHEAAELSPTLIRVPSGGMSVGMSRRQAVSERYEDRGSFRYGGRIEVVRIEPGEQAPDSHIADDEEAVQQALRDKMRA